jgi:hypothetical protein
VRKSGVLVAVVLGTIGAGVSTPAWASVEQTVALTLAASGWSWNPPAGAPLPASTVATAGDLTVAYSGDSAGEPSAKAYLGVALDEVPAKATIVSLPLVLTLDAAAHNVQPSTNALQACLTAGPWKPGEGTAASEQPKDDCSVSALGSYDATAGAYRFDIAALTDAMRENPALGVVVRPSAGYVLPDGAPFQLSFKASATAVSAEVLLPDLATGGGTPEQPPTPPITTPPVTSGGTGFTGGPGFGSGSVVLGGGSGLPVTPNPVTAPLPKPVVDLGPRMSVASKAEIRQSLADSNLPPTGFWLSGAFGLLVLGLISWATGDTRSQARVVRAAARRRATARAVAASRPARAATAVRPRRVIPAGTPGRTADLG